MSFIERALEKARAGAESAPVAYRQSQSLITRAAGSAQAATAPSPPPPMDRVSPSPQLHITETLLKEQGLRPLPGQEQQQRAEYRHIKQRVLAGIADAATGRLVIITSALQGEGKSFSAANLALSLSMDPDYSVLLVDADVIRPNLSRMFGLVDRPGLMEAVADPTIDVQSLVVTTNIEGFSILPAGRTHPNATEFFASARMRELMEQMLSAPNRLVVIDSLPLLQTTEARALMTLGGQVVLVVRAESTPRSAVLQAIEVLGEGVDVKLLLNALVRTKVLDYAGYGYGYNYNYGQEK